MLAIGKFINMPVLDHLIEKIENNSHYDLNFTQIDTLKKELVDTEKKKAIEMARKILEDNQPLETISKYTGLDIKVLKKIKE